MKIKLSILLAVMLILPAVSSCAGKRSETKTPKADDAISTFKSSAGWNKLDGRFKQAWEKAMREGDQRRSFECLVKTKTKMGKGEKREISDAGYAPRSTIGRIATGSVIAENVPKVAALPFVLVMELAVPVSPKK